MTHEHDFNNCKEIARNLNAYIDGELDDEFCGQIEDHIKNCSNCRIVVNTLKKTIEIYQSDGHETKIPPDVRKRLYQSLDLDEYRPNE